MEPHDAFDAPDDAALAGWLESPGAHARVVSSKIINGRAEVVVAVDADLGYCDYAYIVRRDGRHFAEGVALGSSRGRIAPFVTGGT